MASSRVSSPPVLTITVSHTLEAPAGSNSLASRVFESVLVSTGGDETLNGTSADLSNTVTARSIQDLPLNGRSFQGFLILTPGSSSPGPANSDSTTRVNIAVNGQRPT